jgi:HD-GYP domain-containing protein (c-di-GMP phosphodiesterase class II)
MKLFCVEGPDKDTVWDLTGARTVLGRDSVCDIAIDDAKLSRIHAEIIVEGGISIFHDKKSMNGSFINENKVTRQILTPGDEIRIGDTKIQVREDHVAADVKFQDGKPLVTSTIPLDKLSNQIEEVVASSKTIAEKLPKSMSKELTTTERLLKNLETIYEVGNSINSIQTLDELLDQIAEKLLGVFADVQRVCILLKGKGKEFEPKYIKSRPDIPPGSFQISRSILNKSVKEEVCILANDAAQDDRFSGAESIMTMNLRSVMCAPLVYQGEVLGVIYLDNREKPNCFDENDVALLSAMANQSAVAIDNSHLYDDLQKAYHEAILALLNTVEAKDPYTRGHSQRTSRYALGIAQEMELGEEECKRIKTAAELHDIGKIGVRERIIDKESALSTMEFHSIQAHVLTGENILKPIEYLSFVLPMVRGHHEHYGGTGYPDGLKGGKIPLGARILGVADAFDAMTTQRPYNKPVSFKDAMKKLKAQKGKQFDADVVDALDHFLKQSYSVTPQDIQMPKTHTGLEPSTKKKSSKKDTKKK